MTNNPVPPDRPHVYAFSTKRLVLLACIVALLIALGLALGIRIERYQQSQTAGLSRPPDAPEAVSPPAGSAIKKAGDAAARKSRPPASEASGVEPVKPKPAPKPRAVEPKPRAVEPKPAKTVTPPAQPTKPVAAKAEPAAPRGHYAVQVESSQDKSKASLQVETLIRNRFSAYIEQVDLEGKGRFYRVMVGPFQTKTQAKEARDALARDSRFTDSLVRYIP